MAAPKKAVPDGFDREMQKRGFSKRGGEVLKWDEGLEAVGTFMQILPARDEDSSPILVFRNADGKVIRYWCPTILESNLVGVSEGQEIHIICLGRNVKVKRGQDAWGFDVYVK